MLRKDFILAQIEELGKLIAQIVNRRKSGKTHQITPLIENAYSSLNIDGNYLLDNTPEEIFIYLNTNGNSGLQRMEMAAKILVEESFLFPGQKARIRAKAREILEYVTAHDTTFSMERESLLQELREEDNPSQ